MAPRGQNSGRFQSVFTDGISLYNRNMSSLDLGYVNKNASIKISPVDPELRGAKPRAGVQMYLRDRSIFFSLNAQELIWLKYNMEALAQGTLVKTFSHTSREDIKELTIGRNCMGLSEGEEGYDDFGIIIEVFDRESGRDSKPVDSVLFIFSPEESISITEEAPNQLASIYVFAEWVDAALRVCCSDQLHVLRIVRSWDGRGDDGNRGGSRGRDSGYDDDDDGYEDNRPTRRSRGDDDNRAPRRGSDRGREDDGGRPRRGVDRGSEAGGGRPSRRGSEAGGDVPF